MNTKKTTSKIKNIALDKGFDLFGVASPNSQKKYESKILNDWIGDGYHATMDWINKRKEERNNIYKYFPNVKSVISLGYNYYTGENEIDSNKYKISNYAWGEDYHKVIKLKLYGIIEYIKNNIKSEFEYRVCVDTSPLLEKKWAQKAGLGWIGKHTNLINQNIGSWFFLSEILLDFELDFNKPFIEDLCGTCTKCIDECPTDAIIDDYKLDSNKCISYLTIEHRDDFKKNQELDNWIYGCDICQQVCPWNIKFSQFTEDENFKIRKNIKNMSNEDWEKLTDENYRLIFKNSAIKRTKLKGLKRNISTNK